MVSTSYGMAIKRGERAVVFHALREAAARESRASWHAKAAKEFGPSVKLSNSRSTSASRDFPGVSVTFTQKRGLPVGVVRHESGLHLFLTPKRSTADLRVAKAGSLADYSALIAAALKAHAVLARHAPK